MTSLNKLQLNIEKLRVSEKNDLNLCGVSSKSCSLPNNSILRKNKEEKENDCFRNDYFSKSF